MVETDVAYEAYKRLLYREQRDERSPFEIVNVGRRHITIRQVIEYLDEQTVKDVQLVVDYFNQNSTRLEILK